MTISCLSGREGTCLSVSRDDARLSVFRFNSTCESFPYECGQIVNLVVTMESEFRGVVSPTLLGYKAGSG